jgi:hypothetical protein
MLIYKKTNVKRTYKTVKNFILPVSLWMQKISFVSQSVLTLSVVKTYSNRPANIQKSLRFELLVVCWCSFCSKWFHIEFFFTLFLVVALFVFDIVSHLWRIQISPQRFCVWLRYIQAPLPPSRKKSPKETSSNLTWQGRIFTRILLIHGGGENGGGSETQIKQKPRSDKRGDIHTPSGGFCPKNRALVCIGSSYIK